MKPITAGSALPSRNLPAALAPASNFPPAALNPAPTFPNRPAPPAAFAAPAPAAAPPAPLSASPTNLIPASFDTPPHIKLTSERIDASALQAVPIAIKVAPNAATFITLSTI